MIRIILLLTLILNFSFIFPQKKPSIYRSATKEVKKSSILKQKDFEQAKKILNRGK